MCFSHNYAVYRQICKLQVLQSLITKVHNGIFEKVEEIFVGRKADCKNFICVFNIVTSTWINIESHIKSQSKTWFQLIIFWCSKLSLSNSIHNSLVSVPVIEINILFPCQRSSGRNVRVQLPHVCESINECRGHAITRRLRPHLTLLHINRPCSLRQLTSHKRLSCKL